MVRKLLVRVLPLATIFLFFTGALTAQTPCECTNCPQFMPDLFVGSFYLNVQNASNPTLGQNGQGVCGVHVHWDHTAICDISITLTSPSGQTVTLVGPIGQFCTNMGNTGTDWDVTFLPCGDPAVSPDPGFAAQWNSNQNWGANNSYTGSYYPYIGCLQNFTGSVNGIWTLTVTDGQANDVGNLYDYEIIFCDPSGIDCFTCAANAGNLPQSDVTECQNDPALALDLPPTYIPQQPAPPSSEYSYSYVVANAAGVIVAFLDEPDLTALPAGSYTVCGMSYYSADAGDIPNPNGVLTVTQLMNQLNSSQPPFCGDITPNCVGVTIKPLPPDVEETVEICAPGCYSFYDQDFCSSGTYTVDLEENGCPYTGTLYLTVHQPNFTTVFETVCAGNCSTNPLFPGTCSTGTYQATTSNIFGCDSTVTLNLTVLNPIANIQPPPLLACGQNSVQLSGLGSSAGPGVNYLWTASNGGIITGSTNTLVTTGGAAGDYSLRVCRTFAGVTCCDSAMTTVVADNSTPPAPSGITGSSSICLNQSGAYSISGVSGATGYTWTVPAGVTINSGQNTTTINITWNSNTGGNICVAASNACGAGPQICLPVTLDTMAIPATPQGNATVCAGATLAYSIPALPAGTTYNWTVAAPATLVSGQGSSQVMVNWGNAPSGNVCVSATGPCGTSAPMCLPVTITAAPAAPTLSGNVSVCAGNTESYTVAAVPGATSYNWQATGGVVASGNGSSSVQVIWDNNATSGTVCATAVNACAGSAQVCLNVTVNPPLAAPVVSGDATLCPGDTGAYSILPISGATGYLWTLPNGANLLTGQNTTAISVNWPAAPGGNVCVAAVSACGTGQQQCFPVLVNPTPVANAGADGAVCGTVFTVNAVPGNTGSTGVWTTLSGPGSLGFANAGSDTTTVTASQNGTYLLQWTESSAGCSDVDTVQLNFNASPVSGILSNVCDPNNQNYTVTIPLSGGLAPYSVNGVPLAGNSYVSAPIPSGLSYSFTVTDANGCAAPTINGAYNCNCATNAGQMNLQTLSACADGTVAADFLGGENLDGNDTVAYVLHTGAGTTLGTVLAQNGTGVFGFQPGMTYGNTYYISLVAGDKLNGQPDPADPCFSVAQGQPVVFYDYPVAMAGANDAVCGLSLNLNGTGTGVWSLLTAPAGGNLSIANSQDPATQATATQYGLYTLNWTVTANNCSSTDQVSIQFNDSPSLLDLQRSCDPANENYTVTLSISGGTAPYTVNGAPIAGATFTSPAFPNGDLYTFEIADANGCSMPQINGSYSCNCATNAGTLSTQILQACEGSTVTAQSNNNQTLDANDVTAYVLHNNAGPALGQVFAENTTGVFGFQPGMSLGQTYYISLVAGNPLNGAPDPADPCFSVAPGQPVVFLQIPSPTAGADDAICGQSIDLQAQSSGFNGVWTQLSGTGTSSFSASVAPDATVTASAFGDYLFEWSETNGICSAADTVLISFHESPAANALLESCNPTNTQYSVSFDVQGGAAPYTVSGLSGTFTGNTFNSALLANGSNYSFTVTDANGCVSGAVAGAHNCNCLTDAGNMLATPAVFCADVPASATWNNNAALDGDDIVQFILHDQSGTSLGTVYATSNQPAFPFTGALQTGTIYYISAIAGNNQGGQVALNDPCLSISPGAPVQWKPLPTATLSGDATICNGTVTVLNFSGTGVYPLQLTYSDGSPAPGNLIIGNAQVIAVPVMPTATTTYTLVSVSDATLPTCSAVLSQSATITVSQPVTAGTADAPLEFCAGTAQIIPLGGLLTGADAGGQWSDVSTVPALPGAFNAAAGTFSTAAQPAGAYVFRYRLDAQEPCPDATNTVSVILHALPNADAGADQSLDCNQSTATLGGPGTTQGVQYAWSLNGAPAGTAYTLDVAAPGTYTLSVTNAAGCTDTDLVTVTQDAEVPMAFAISKTDVHCYGEKNGRIVVDSIVSSHPPVMVALNHGAYGAQTEFYPLEAGAYTVSLLDANGCEWEAAPITITQPQQLTVELGDDLTVILGEQAIVQADISVPLTALDTIIWTPLLDTLNAGTDLQQFVPLTPQKISIVVVDSNGCTVNDRVNLYLKKLRNVYIPNIIDPQSGLNTALMVYGGPDVAEIESFQIFDRWGDKVFAAEHFPANDQTVRWEGKFNGENVLPGVYVYCAVVRFIDEEKLVFKGDVTVFR